MNVYPYLGREFRCPCCKMKHRIPIKRVENKSGAIQQIGDFLSSVANPAKRRILLLADNITWEVAGKRCQRILERDFKPFPLIFFPRNEKRVSAKEEYLPEIFEKGRGVDYILTVGTGTITDLGKYTGDKLKTPVFSFPTAPSMNAYTSGVASLISKGLKVTLPVEPAIGVLVDTEIISEAPLDLIKAGFADSLAKVPANSDWKIASLITGEDFCLFPLKIVREIEEEYINQGDKLLRRDRNTIASLMEGLNIGGISMLIAGKSSPASGGEHLISHFLDMCIYTEGREIFAYHGIQVGIGVLIACLIYQRLREISEHEVKKLLSLRNIDYQEKFNTLKSRFFGSNRLLRTEFEKKIELMRKLREKLPYLWEQIKKEAFPMVCSFRKVKKYLIQADCPLTFREIGVNEELGYNAILLSRYIRGRITILDIADELGVLEEVAESFIKEE